MSETKRYKGWNILKKPVLRVRADRRWSAASGIAANGYVRSYRWSAQKDGRRILGCPSLRALKENIDLELPAV